MDWKAFLKPEGRKFTLTIILWLVIPFPYEGYFELCNISSYCTNHENGTIYCPTNRSCSFITITAPFGYVIIGSAHYMGLEDMLGALVENTFSHLFLLIVSYLLSCTIIFLYNKYKKK